MWRTKSRLISAFQQQSIQQKFTQCLHEQQLLHTRHVTTVSTQTPNVDVNASISNATEWKNARPYEQIPTMSAFSLVRQFLPGGRFYKKDTVYMVESLRQEHGDIFRMPGMFGRPAIVFTHNPVDFECAFRNEGVWPVRPGGDTIRHHRSKYRADFYQGVEGIIATQGEKWGKFRTAVNPVLMQPKNVTVYLQKMSDVNLDFIERIKEIRDPATLEVPAGFEEEMNRWTLESIAVVALDKKLGLLKHNHDDELARRFFKVLNDFFTLSIELEFKPSMWRLIPTPKYRKLMQVFDDMQSIVHAYVNEAVERLEREAAAADRTRSESEKSVLAKLLKIDKKVAIVMAMDLLMAGVDTTTSALTGVLLCLAKNPAKQAKLREEVMRILPAKDSEFTEAAMKNSPYLRACIKEALRIYPVVIGNARCPQYDVVLSGYQVPKGTMVSMFTASLNTDERFYPRSDEFLPERWLRPATTNTVNELKVAHPFVYLPFGFGSRSCIGKRIVDMELEVATARLVRNFQVEFNHPTENAFKSVMINMPNIPLRFKFSDL